MVLKQGAGYLLALLILCLPSTRAEKPRTFAAAGGTLLFAGDWNIEIVTPISTEVIPLPINPEGRKGPSAVPGFGPKGMLVSSGFPVANDSGKKWKARCAVAIYSFATKQWKTYGDFSQVYMGSISPDGTKLAFVADSGERDTRKVLLLDLNSGRISELARLTAVWVSWSPDGQRLVVGTSGGDIPEQMEILDLSSNTKQKLANGNLPAWSPSGTWIAYIDPTGQRVRLIRPDGTDDHVVRDVSGHLFWGDRSFGFAPVWSPDETKLLLNYYIGQNLDSQDVVLLDLVTGEMTKQTHNGLPVFAWKPFHN